MPKKFKLGLSVYLLTVLISAFAFYPPVHARETFAEQDRPAEIETRVPMRDGVKLLTYINLPSNEGKFPVVLVRTPYMVNILARSFGMKNYLDAGYAVVWQLARGIGDNEGTYRFIADDRNDGYDCIEWIAAQPWCDGNVGMDHGSYNAMTQLQAASTKPPHLKAIIPFVTSAHFFRETPYWGGIFMRYHMLNWHKVLTVKSFEELGVGFMDPTKIVGNPEWERMLSIRPVIDAANDYLAGDQLAQYKAFLKNPTLTKEYWHEIMLMDEHYANIDIPVLLVTGNFDPSIGTLHTWKQLEKNAPNPQHRKMLIGPWTHGTAYSGMVNKHGSYTFGDHAMVNMSEIRIAFFDRYLKGIPASKSLPQRVRVFVTGSNVWKEFDTLPVPDRVVTNMYLSSGGRANSSNGDGFLSNKALDKQPADTMIADPENPVVVITNLMEGTGDFQETHRDSNVLVYSSPPLEHDLTIIGESNAVIYVSCTTPDADLVVSVSEVFPDGRAIALGAGGALRLRYWKGFDKERKLEISKVYKVEIPVAYIGHTLAAGNRLRFTISGTAYPLLDPNPNTGEDIATATRFQKSKISIHHSAERPSRIELPVVD